MRTAFSAAAIGVLVAAFLVAPVRQSHVQAQSATSASCTSKPIASPMQGHYTGPWHSDGDYHFAVFGTDLDLKVTLDGTLDTAVSPDGQVSGTAAGKVDAPITAYGRPDISGGVGTINGQIRGVFSPGGLLLVLTNAVIDMHWGTFGGGHAIERMISMPDYTFSVGTADCVSTSGSIAETNFPVQNIVADEAGKMVQLPGIGKATGTWQLQNDKAARFHELSQQVTAFLSMANGILDAGPSSLSVNRFMRQIAQPLHTLQETIQQDPSVSRCLLQQLAVWEGSTIARLREWAQGASRAATVADLRPAADALRVAQVLDIDCSLGVGDAMLAVDQAEQAMLDRAISAHDWTTAALATRELLLSGIPSTQVETHVATTIHGLLPTTTDSALMSARFAYAVGDVGDARALISFPRLSNRAEVMHQEKKRKKKKKHAKAAPRPTAVSVPQPTPTAAPPSLTDMLLKGVVRMSGSDSGGGTPRFSWQGVSGATRYVLTVTSSSANAIAWSWAGKSTTTSYGDTSIDEAPGTADDGWTASLSQGYRWSVLALNDGGQIVGMKLP